MELNKAPTRCWALPLPELAKSIFPGCDLASATSSRTEPTGTFCGLTTSAYGPEAISAMWVKSFSASYGSFL
jgi:hypothetical protein